MAAPDPSNCIEAQIELWRGHRQRGPFDGGSDLVALEQRLRAQMRILEDAGLSADEALLIASKRIGESDPSSQQFAAEYAARQFKPVAAAPGVSAILASKDAVVAFCLALVAALAIKLPELFGLRLGDEDAGFYARNLSLLVLPVLAAYFVWKRAASSAARLGLVAAFAAAAVFANAYPIAAGYPQELTALHLPIALWLLIGIAYTGARWREVGGRMDFVRFSGELFIHYVLIALGGIVFTGVMMLLFQAIGIDMELFFQRWLLPCAAAGAVLIAAWLVDAKQGVIGNIAPMLTRLFTPLFTVLLLAFLATMLWTGRGLEFQRELIIALDLLLAIVLGLLLYSISARDPRLPPGWFDTLQVVLVICALLVDAMALWVIAARISEFGFSPNRVAALGENLILLVNLAWSAVLYIRFLRHRAAFADLERWQTGYLPIYALWAAIIVVVFPPAFGYG